MKLFYRPYFRSVVFWAALLSQLLHVRVFFTYSGSDRNQQILASLNWLQGKGLTVPSVSATDLTQVIYLPLHGWPPGYSYLAGVVYRLIGGSEKDWGKIFFTAELLEYLGVILVFAGTHFLLNLLRKEISALVYPLLFIFWVFSFTPFHFTTASEEIALGFFLLATGAWVKGTLSDNLDLRWITAAFAGFMLAGWFRYAYIPLVIVGPVILCISRWNQGSERKKRALGVTLVGLGLMVVLWWALSPSHSQAGGLTEMASGRRFFPENLLKMTAFPLKSLFFIGGDALILKLGIRDRAALVSLRLLFVVSSVALLLFPIRMWSQYGKDFIQSKPLARPVSGLLTAMFLVVLLIVIGFLSLLSFLNPVEVYSGNTWTYVEETRYYAPLLVAFALFLLVRFLDHDTSRLGRSALRFFLLAALLFSVGHKSYRYYTRFVKKDTRETRHDPGEQFFTEVYEYVKRQKENRSVPLVFASGKEFWEQDEAVVAAWAGAGIIPFEKLTDTTASVRGPVEILVRTGGSIRKSDLKRFAIPTQPPVQLLSHNGITLYGLMFSIEKEQN
ncbi:MAG: hypothetical protein SF052_04340 [Bacteroidia bacterium]|nr:hypothetical protein [Bacteroidia bacterium]